MKRSREEEIMFGAFQKAGCDVTAAIKKAISDGLRQIRQERYEERKAQKDKARQKIRLPRHRPAQCARS